MSTTGNNELNKGIPTIKDAFVVIVKTEWNAHITDKLEEGCIKLLTQNEITWKTIIVPGAFEIPFAVRMYRKQGLPHADAFVAFGVVIKGDTPHFDYVCKGVTDGIVLLNNSIDVPTVFGILTVDNETQALERIGGKHGHKGEEAAITAIKMIHFSRSLHRI